MGSVIMKRKLILFTFLTALLTAQAPIKAAGYADDAATAVTVEELVQVLKSLDAETLQELDAETLAQLKEIVAQAQAEMPERMSAEDEAKSFAMVAGPVVGGVALIIFSIWAVNKYRMRKYQRLHNQDS